MMNDLEKRIEKLESQSLFEEIRTFKISKRTKAAIITSLLLSASNSIRSALTEKIDIFFNGGESMDIASLLRPDFVTIAFFLWIVGAILKYRTELTNNAIPIVLFGVAFVISSIWGWTTSNYFGSARVIDAFIICGIVHGVIVTAIAAYGWDVVNGFKKGIKK